MDFSELEIGMTVRIIEWDYRPSHWESEMDHWQGELVTVVDLHPTGEHVFLDDDGGEWQWFPWDFEPYYSLPEDNPNILYKRLEVNRILARVKANFDKGIKFE